MGFGRRVRAAENGVVSVLWMVLLVLVGVAVFTRVATRRMTPRGQVVFVLLLSLALFVPAIALTMLVFG